jgi:hypothetical protein
MKIVAVQFGDRARPGEFRGKEYHCIDATEGRGGPLAAGDAIWVPAGAGESVARASDADVPDGRVGARAAPLLREITELRRASPTAAPESRPEAAAPAAADQPRDGILARAGSPMRQDAANLARNMP